MKEVKLGTIQFIRYCTVGGMGFLIFQALLYVLTENFFTQIYTIFFWKFPGYMISSTIATLVAVIFNFFGNKYYTFNTKQNRWHPFFQVERLINRFYKKLI